MRTNSRIALEAAAALAIGAVLFGCAPQVAQPKTQGVDRMSAMVQAGSSAISGGTDWSCPNMPNVNLTDNVSLAGGYDYSGAEDFRVCVPAGSRGNATTFQVNGSSGSQALCFYPMNQPPGGYPTLVAAPQCFAVKNDGAPIMLSFQNPTTTINVLVVVDSNYTQALQTCMTSNQACPAHSQGVVQ